MGRGWFRLEGRRCGFLWERGKKFGLRLMDQMHGQCFQHQPLGLEMGMKLCRKVIFMPFLSVVGLDY
ncbi:hypothetical protein FF1_006215 [Malus domestica]